MTSLPSFAVGLAQGFQLGYAVAEILHQRGESFDVIDGTAHHEGRRSGDLSDRIAQLNESLVELHDVAATLRTLAARQADLSARLDRLQDAERVRQDVRRLGKGRGVELSGGHARHAPTPGGAS